MDTDVRTPIPSLPPPSTSTPPRRRRRIFTVAIAVLVMLVIGATVWISNVEPLEEGSFGFDPLAGLPPSMARTAKVQDVDAFGVDGRVLTIRVAPGDRFTVTVSIRNAGPVPVTIGGIGSDREGIRQRLVGMTPDLVTTGMGQRLQPFRPFSLASGGEAALEIEISIGDRVCLAPNSITSGYEQRLAFTVFGVQRAQWVDAGLQLNLRGTKRSAC